MFIDTFFENWRDAGQALLAETVRHGLRVRCPELADRVAAVDVLDPFAFIAALAPSPGLGVEQCVWGLLPSELRPGRTRVKAFADGRVLLPGLGWLCGAPPSDELELVEEDGRPQISGHPQLAFEPFEAIARGARPTLYPHRHPPLRPFLERHGQHYEAVEIAGATAQNREALELAWELFAGVWPEQRAEFDRDLRMVVLVSHPKVNSMAAPGIHGAIFVTTRGREGPLFFVEELAHQSGHVTFTKVIADWQAFLAIPYETPVSVLTGNASDPRSFGDAVHGNYTMVRMVQSFARLLETDDGTLNPDQMHELWGRMALGMIRLQIGLREIEHPRLYTAQGLRLHRRLTEAWAEIDGRYGDRASRLDVSDQAYVFEAARFFARNPKSG